MDYTRSAQIRSKSLAELVFEQDRTLREAMSDKFKARMMGIKEKFTPLNFVRMLTGSGGIGRSIRTVAGRAMGYSERDIERFGGYKRKRSIYGPDRSRVPAGARTPAKVGDSTADILAKIYNLMRKIDEDNTRRYEEEQNYTEENQFENRKRHGKLLEALGMKKKDTGTPKTYAREKPKEQEDKSSSILGKIFSSIFGVFGKTFKMLASLGGIIVSAVTGLFGMIKSLMGMAKTIISTVMELVAKMVMPLIEGIFNSVVKFITKILPQFASGIMTMVTKMSNTLLEIVQTIGEIISVLPVGKAGKILNYAKLLFVTGLSMKNAEILNPTKEESIRLENRAFYVGPAAEEKYRESKNLMGEALTPDIKEDVREKLYAKAKQMEEEAVPLAIEHQASLASGLLKLGYNQQGYDRNNLPIFKNASGQMPTAEELITASSISAGLQQDNIDKSFLSKIDPRNSEIYHKALDKFHDETNRITSVGEQFKTMMDKVINIPSQMADEGSSYIKDALAQAGDFISHITGPTEQTIAMPTIRNTEKTFQDRIRAITYVV